VSDTETRAERPSPSYDQHRRTGRDDAAWRREPDRRESVSRSRHPLAPLAPEPSGNPRQPHGQGPLLAEVTNAIVQLHRMHYGKGPTRSKSYMLDDVLICVMRDVFTTVERTLIEAGEPGKVRETRLAFQDAMQDAFTEAVERITGRRVLGVTTQVLVDQGLAIEAFVLSREE
jgi:uncharacterized protein YbcI